MFISHKTKNSEKNADDWKALCILRKHSKYNQRLHLYVNRERKINTTNSDEKLELQLIKSNK